MVTKPSTAEMLASVELFDGLSRRELSLLEQLGKEMDFSAGEAITEEGETGGRFYLILDGQATVSTYGTRRGTLGAGDYFGEISLIDGGPRSATVIADTPLKTFTLASFNFTPFLGNQPAIAVKLLKEMCRRLRAAEAVDE